MTDDAIHDPARLRALRELELLDTPPEEAFDRLTRLAARILDTPLALVNLIDEERQFSKSCFAPPEWSAGREASLKDSFCKHTVVSREPLLIRDARENALVASSSFVTDLGVRSYVGVPLATAEGQVLGTLCAADFAPRTWSGAQVEVLQDLAASVVTEMELRRRLLAGERRYQSVVESIRDYGILHLDPEGRILAWNTGAELATGYPREEVLGSHFSLVYRQEDIDRGAPERELVEAREQGRAEREEWRVRKDGALYWDHEVLTPIRAREGALEGYVKVTRDLTERKRAEERERRLLQEQAARAEAEAAEHRIADILGSITDAFFAVDREWRLAYLNRRGEELLRVRREEALGRNAWDLVPRVVGSPAYRACQRAMAERIPLDLEIPSREASGVWLHLHITPTRDGLALFVRDVTRRKEAEQAAQQAREEAEAANRAKSEFLSRMSHELRTPLNAILGFGQLLEMDVEREEDRESVDQILRAGRHLMGLIDEVLDIARIEAGRMRLSIEPVPVGELLRESLDLVRPLAAERRVVLRAGQAPDPDPLVWADPQRLKQVLLNLLSNAIKYNHADGTVTLSCEEPTDEHLRIAVRDTGPGIPADRLGRLFTPFERLGAEETGVVGTGLGLALSKRLVEAMGGTLGVESVEGEGSTFWVELLLPRPEGPAPPPGAGGEPTGSTAGGAAETTHTVLLVEDNLANARLIAHILQRRPEVRLLSAMQGSRGLELAREHRPDLILLDFDLPDLLGDEILERLRRDPALRDIPVVMISGGATPAQVERMISGGARAYLAKPFGVEDLLRIVDESLRGGEP